jgi:hypothetical protein
MGISHDELVKKNKAYTLASWTTQNAWNPNLYGAC